MDDNVDALYTDLINFSYLNMESNEVIILLLEAR